MHPALWEINLNTVNICHFELFVTAFYHTQYAINIDLRSKFYFVFRCVIVRIFGTQLADFLTFFRQMSKEQCHTHQGITATVRCRIDDTTITLATNNGIGFTDFSHYVDLAYCRNIVLSAMLGSNIS